MLLWIAQDLVLSLAATFPLLGCSLNFSWFSQKSLNLINCLLITLQMSHINSDVTNSIFHCFIFQHFIFLCFIFHRFYTFISYSFVLYSIIYIPSVCIPSLYIPSSYIPSFIFHCFIFYRLIFHHLIFYHRFNLSRDCGYRLTLFLLYVMMMRWVGRQVYTSVCMKNDEI